jgi:hypothetical protein
MNNNDFVVAKKAPRFLKHFNIHSFIKGSFIELPFETAKMMLAGILHLGTFFSPLKITRVFSILPDAEIPKTTENRFQSN